MLRTAGLPHKAKACRPRAFHYNSQADDVCASSSDGKQILSDDDAEVLTVSSSVSWHPAVGGRGRPSPSVGVPGSPDRAFTVDLKLGGFS
jgi:hypothetical protein